MSQDEQGVLCFGLERVDGSWQIVDIDMESSRGTKEEIGDFLKRHPAAQTWESRETTEDDTPTERPSGFGPVIERVVNDDGMNQNFLIDLDTGKLYTPGADLTSDAQTWMREKGIDAGGETNPSGPGLFGIDMLALRVANTLWEDKKPLLGLRDELVEGKPGSFTVMSALAPLPATYLFKTREGGLGILQVMELQTKKDPEYIKIRYKLLERLAPRVTAPPAEPVRRAYIPDADTRGAKVILDLMTGEMLPAGEREEQLTYVTKLGKGDLAFDGQLICLRGGSAKRFQIWSGAHWVFTSGPTEQIGDTKTYDLREVPCGLLVWTGDGLLFEVKVLSREESGINIEYRRLPEGPQHKVYIPWLFKPGGKVVLDLANGEMLPLISQEDEGYKHFIEIGKGDLAFEDVLVTLRGARISLWKEGKWQLMVPQEEDKELGLAGYQLPKLACRLLVTTGDGLKFEVTVVSEEDEGIHIEYRQLEALPPP